MIHVLLTFGSQIQVKTEAKKEELWMRATGCEKAEQKNFLFVLKLFELLAVKKFSPKVRIIAFPPLKSNYHQTFSLIVI